MVEARRARRLKQRRMNFTGCPLKTTWTTLLLYSLIMPFVHAFLVLERRIQGHVQTSEIVQNSSHLNAEGRSVQSSYLLTVEALAQDVATGVTYFLKNVHERMVITNISIKDNLVLGSVLKFEVVHGRQSNFVGGVDRLKANIYVDSTIQQVEQQLAKEDLLFGEISGLSQQPSFNDFDRQHSLSSAQPGRLSPGRKADKKKNQGRQSRKRKNRLVAFVQDIIDWWYAEAEEEEDRPKT